MKSVSVFISYSLNNSCKRGLDTVKLFCGSHTWKSISIVIMHCNEYV